MDITISAETPQDVREFPVDNELNMQPEHVAHVAEIFQTPLTGSFNWDYTVQDNRIKRLYELGKELNWNAETDIDWNNGIPKPGQLAPEANAFVDYAPYKAMSEEQQLEMNRHLNCWALSQFLHGEQGALLVASQLATCAPTYNAKLYAASQTFDEARHVEVFNKYLQQRVGMTYPIDDALKSLLDKILTDPRWDLKFIGMQLVIEGFALAAFATMRQIAEGTLLDQILHYVIRDEARHVTFGVNYLEDFVNTLSEEEKEERAMFAYEACVVARERMVPTAVFRHYGWDIDEAREVHMNGPMTKNFRHLLFTRIMPNLKRIGLLTDAVRPKFEELGILQFEDMPNDYDIDWVELSKPLTAA